ncbi:MAG: RidA family protein [Candidatus Asgardarchaeia archaeon]
MVNIEKRLEELGIELPEAPRPIAAYIPALLSTKYLFVSGQIPIKDGKLMYKGKLGKDLTVEEGYEAAKICAINILSAAKSVIGDLNNIIKVVRIAGYVNSTDSFEEHSKVVNGASDLLVEVFKDSGKHVRIAVGVNSLPLGAPVEIEAVFEIEK